MPIFISHVYHLYPTSTGIFLSLQNTTLMQLKKAYYNRKPVEKPRKKTMMEQTSENESTEEGHASQLIKEMKKKTPDVKTIHSLLTVSFNHRRKWITKLQGKGTVKRILEEYPGFRSFPQVILRFRATYFCSCFKLLLIITSLSFNVFLFQSLAFLAN